MIVDRIREWAGIYGGPPAIPDWNPCAARNINDPNRAQPFITADGYWPQHTTVYRYFTSWNAALEAAGFDPRPAHGGGGNAARRRKT